MEKQPLVSVAVCTYNRVNDLIKCLKALLNQNYKNFDVVIVNGGEKKPVEKAIKDFSNLPIRLVEQKKKGVVDARNLGWKNSKGKIVCLIDDDLVVSPVWLERIVETFLSSNKIGGVSGPTIIPYERRKNRDFALLLEENYASGNIFLGAVLFLYKSLVLENKMLEVGKILKSGAFTPGSNYERCLKYSGLIEVDYLEACHMCFRKYLLEKVGGFDDSYFGTGEWNEPELAFKIRDLGYRLVFNPKAVTEHHISQGGVFKARTNAYERSVNFIHFYLKCVRADSLEKIFRFSVNLFFINSYWVFKFISSKNPDWLKGVLGTIDGLFASKLIRLRR